MDNRVVSDWVCQFVPSPALGVERSPDWFTVRYSWPTEKLLFRIFDIVGFNYHVFTYRQKQQRPKGSAKRPDPVTRSWFPGYVFINVDIERDHWQQIYQMPGFLAILGRPTPLPPGEIERVDQALLKWLPAAEVGATFNPGDNVRILNGPFTSFLGVVESTFKSHADVWAFIFGRSTKVSLSFNDIEKI
jgi:transcription antitermination factor NusG